MRVEGLEWTSEYGITAGRDAKSVVVRLAYRSFDPHNCKLTGDCDGARDGIRTNVLHRQVLDDERHPAEGHRRCRKGDDSRRRRRTLREGDGRLWLEAYPSIRHVHKVTGLQGVEPSERPNESRLSCGALRKDSFLNLRAPPASSACKAAGSGPPARYLDVAHTSKMTTPAAM